MYAECMHSSPVDKFMFHKLFKIFWNFKTLLTFCVNLIEIECMVIWKQTHTSICSSHSCSVDGSKQLTHLTTLQDTWPCHGFNIQKGRNLKIKLTWAPGKVNMAGVILTLLLTKCRLVYENMVACPICIREGKDPYFFLYSRGIQMKQVHHFHRNPHRN